MFQMSILKKLTQKNVYTPSHQDHQQSQGVLEGQRGQGDPNAERKLQKLLFINYNCEISFFP